MNVPQLKSERDWLVWKYQVKHAMKAAGLWDRVTGTASREGADAMSLEQKSLYLVLQCIGQKYVPMAMNCKTTKELWDTLCQCFERKTVSNKVHTLMQLYGLRMKRGTKIQDRLHELDELLDKLAAIGENVAEVHEVAVLLRSMQDRYPTLVTALLARRKSEVTLMFVKQSLLDEEQRSRHPISHTGREAGPKDSKLALKAGQRFKRKKKSGTCHNCGQKGHFIRNCPQLLKDKLMHHAKTAEVAQEESDSDRSVLFVTTVGLKADTKDPNWLIDSGDSRHMTCQ